MTSEQKEKMIREEWFKEHVAKEKIFTNMFNISLDSGLPEEEIRVIDWHKTNTSIYGIRYIIDRNYLLVTGDVGEAIYQWSQVIDLPFLASCDMSYFVSKCQSSEYGRGGQSWDRDLAENRLNEMMWEETKEWVLVKSQEISPEELWKNQAQKNQLINEYLIHMNIDIHPNSDFRHCTDTKEDWHGFLKEHGYDFFGSDYGEFGGIGMTQDIRHVGHWLGLKMAYEQLKGK